MATKVLRSEPPAPSLSSGGRARVKPWLPLLLIWVGGLLTVGSLVYASLALLTTWVAQSDRYLVLSPVVALAGLDLTPLPGIQDGVTAPALGEAVGGPSSRVAPASLAPSEADEPEELTVARPLPTATPPATLTPRAPLPGTPVPATPTPKPDAPVRIRIPSIGVDRSIVEVPLVQNPRTGAWERNLDRLLSRPGKDLVGHWGGSAYPGEAGNMILVGHNYGYGYNAVFVRLGRVKVGQKVSIVTETGRTFTYEVKAVAQVPWRRKDQAELMQHQSYLVVTGPERLTLVSCGGATWEPFPVRVYVVAEPAR